jgi:hypothetical protein
MSAGILKKGEKKRSALLICRDIFDGKKKSSFSEKGFTLQSIIFTFVFEKKGCNRAAFPSRRKSLSDSKNRGRHPLKYAPMPLASIIRQSMAIFIVLIYSLTEKN